MKRILLLLSLILISNSAYADTSLDIETQRQIIEDYMFVTGQRTSLPSSLSDIDDHEDHAIKCGTPTILRFMDNYNRLDKDLLSSMNVQLFPRPQLSFQYDTPGGEIRLHYEKSGLDAVFGANQDSDGDGTPNYVESLGLIADSVYDITINQLGFARPMDDTLCNLSNDRRIDIYIMDLDNAFGFTFPEDTCFIGLLPKSIASYISIENDFQDQVFAQFGYNERPLDAARVTIAHEFFHTVHFNMDALESPVLIEASAVWMEEFQYDHINDYYNLIDQFFLFPRVSLQSTGLESPFLIGLHEYASMVFLQYLTEKHNNSDLIRAIWTRSADIGVGDDWLQAVDEVVDSITNGSMDFAKSLQEFAVWNYFTGIYANQAPDTIGYEEKEFYPEIPVSQMDVYTSYPFLLGKSDNNNSPAINAAAYVRFEEIQDILIDYYICDTIRIDTTMTNIDTVCTDSSLAGFYIHQHGGGCLGPAGALQQSRRGGADHPTPRHRLINPSNSQDLSP